MGKLSERLTSFARNVVDKVQESQKPIIVRKPDEHRIDREVAYAKRIHKANSKLEALNERRLKAQKRRSL